MTYYFKPEQFPKNHCFAKQNQPTQSGMFFILKGAVELRQESMKTAPVFHGLPQMGNKVFGCLTSGGIFGSMKCGEHEPFSIVAVTEPVVVYKVVPEDLKALKKESGLLNASLHILQKFSRQAELQLSWRVSRCDTTSNTLVGLATPGKTPKKVPEWPPYCSRFARQRHRKPPGKTLALDDIPEPDLTPGEVLALTGERPRMLSTSRSAPSLNNPLEREYGEPVWPKPPSSRPVSALRAAQNLENTLLSSVDSRPTTAVRNSLCRPWSGMSSASSLLAPPSQAASSRPTSSRPQSSSRPSSSKVMRQSFPWLVSHRALVMK